MSSEPTIPLSLENIDVAWIAAVLDHVGHRGLVSAEVAPIGTGQMATSVRAQLTFSHESDAPASVVIKLASSDPNSREAGARGAYLREVRYYQELDANLRVCTPACLWAGIDTATNAFALVLEDMSPAVQGDQIAGCSVDDAHAAAINIAGLHAPTWCDDTLFDLAWLTVPRDQRAASYHEAMTVLAPMTEGFIHRYQGRITPRQSELLRWFVTHVEEWLATDRGRFALTHADHRLDNLLFADDRPEQPVTVVDWQTIGVRNPLADVAYLLGTGLVSDVRRAVESDIVADYHRELLALGVDGYSLEECQADYREQTPHALLITVLGSMMTGQTDRGDDMFMAMLQRSSQQIFDLDVWPAS